MDEHVPFPPSLAQFCDTPRGRIASTETGQRPYVTSATCTHPAGRLSFTSRRPSCAFSGEEIGPRLQQESSSHTFRMLSVPVRLPGSLTEARVALRASGFDKMPTWLVAQTLFERIPQQPRDGGHLDLAENEDLDCKRLELLLSFLTYPVPIDLSVARMTKRCELSMRKDCDRVRLTGRPILPKGCIARIPRKPG